MKESKQSIITRLDGIITSLLTELPRKASTRIIEIHADSKKILELHLLSNGTNAYYDDDGEQIAIKKADAETDETLDRTIAIIAAYCIDRLYAYDDKHYDFNIKERFKFDD